MPAGPRGSSVRRRPPRLAALAVIATGTLAVAAAPAAAAPPVFAAPTAVTVGTGPQGVALASLDADGTTDIAVTNTSANSLTILRNTTGTGASFTASTITSGVGNAPIALVAVDVEGDGDDDLAVVRRDNNRVEILRNNGAAAFTSIQSVNVNCTSPSAIAAGDLEGDGDPDLAVACSGSAEIAVLRHGGTTANPYAVTRIDTTGNDDPVAVATGDLNGDGRLDVVTANGADGSLTVFRNTTTTGAPAFATSGINLSQTPSAVRTADLDADGDLDLVVARSGNASAAVYTNSGTGTFALASGSLAVATGARGLVTADLDGDRRTDAVAVGSQNTSNVALLEGRAASPHLQVPASGATLSAGNGPRQVAAGDLDGDDAPDLVVTNGGTNTVSVFRNTTPVTVAVSATGSLAFGAVAVGDTPAPRTLTHTVQTNARGGYQLLVQRTAFTNGDLPLRAQVGTVPAGATSPVAAAPAAVGTGSLALGGRDGALPGPGADSWTTAFTLGPIPFTAAGAHTSTLTVTAVTLP